ncbi:hypothetical protein DCC39_15220 [Pueribacillus theae]|uniref:Uncharacterized protein n=1 Tax=Pueribacillus theae TaxID=2171751 RepID=A0A2U1JSY9_9BACI|nr:hypothetical protein [Pueribacillus theae]PWA08281.1 hypothetical protein DCC39_15220 [Pueribacillus theae]
MRLFYKEAKELADKALKNEQEITIIQLKKENKTDYDLQVIRLQRALRKVYEEGYNEGLKNGLKSKFNFSD